MIPKDRNLRLAGSIPPEIWNRLDTKLISKLRSGPDLILEMQFSATVDVRVAASRQAKVQQALDELRLSGKVRFLN